jgi:hypothetical protein
MIGKFESLGIQLYFSELVFTPVKWTERKLYYQKINI